MAHFFTADTHFADDPIRRIFGRPFPSAAAVDAAMIARAGIVGGDDDLWIIGDFAACETDQGRAAAQAAFAALPGRKHLVRGNHDPDWVTSGLPWASVHDLVEVEADGRRLVLCHYPLVTWNNVRAGRGAAVRPCPHPLARGRRADQCGRRPVGFHAGHARSGRTGGADAAARRPRIWRPRVCGVGPAIPCAPARQRRRDGAAAAPAARPAA